VISSCKLRDVDSDGNWITAGPWRLSKVGNIGKFSRKILKKTLTFWIQTAIESQANSCKCWKYHWTLWETITIWIELSWQYFTGLWKAAQSFSTTILCSAAIVWANTPPQSFHINRLLSLYSLMVCQLMYLWLI